MKWLIVIGGATATGKTTLAIRLAQRYQTAILSADSRQFFKEMSIGTAKATASELQSARHYFVDSLSIEADYSVGDYERDALLVLEDVFNKKDVAILAGGSGLYLRAVCEGLDAFPPVDDAAREWVAQGFESGGLQWMQETLQQLDPDYFHLVDLNNPARLRRALEVCRATALPYSTFRQKNHRPRSFKPVYLLLELPRATLYQKIEERVEQMLQQGLEQEARALLPYRDKAALKTVGYEEFFAYFDGTMDYSATVEKIKQHSRNYAKRQATWFRKHGDWNRFAPDDWEGITEFLRNCGLPG